MAGPPLTIYSFYEFLREKKLMAAKCLQCNSIWLPPRPLCIRCYSGDLQWMQLSGRGKLIAFSVISFGTVPMMNAGYSREKPYCVGIVEVEEGPRISAEILGADTIHPERIKIGTPLEVEFVERWRWHMIREIAEIKRMCAAFRVASA